MMLQAVSSGAAVDAPLSVPLHATTPVDLPAAEVEAEETFEEEVAYQPAAEIEAEAAHADEPMAVTVLMQRGPNVAENPGTLQKMKDQGFYRQQYFKEGQCFECDHKFKVGRSSRSANCPNCGAYISLEDIELNMPSSQSIKTRGDVLIRKRGQLTATHLYARELRCYGTISANMNCSGDAIFRTNGTIVGEVHCRRFIVEKGAEITFMNSIYADEVEIHASITGNVFSKGPLLISANGAVNGDVTARSVSIEPGGELNGAMNIVRISAAPAPTPPVG
jgi:cytoskeletal protein CcmA (bactofilin family)